MVPSEGVAAFLQTRKLPGSISPKNMEVTALMGKDVADLRVP
jgi:hypothetical protein